MIMSMDIEAVKAKNDLPELLGKLSSDKEFDIFITRDHSTVAKLINYDAKPYERREFKFKNKFTIPDDWDKLPLW